MEKCEPFCLSALRKAHNRGEASAYWAAVNKTEIKTVDSEGKTPLMRVSDNAELYEMLLPYSEPSTQDLEGKTALMHAIQQGNERAIELTKTGRNQKDEGGKSVLMYAAEKGSVHSVEGLLSYEEAQCQDQLGMTALMYAAQASAIDVIQLLRHWSPISVSNRFGQTALMIACSSFEQAALPCVELLLPDSCLEALDAKGWAARQWAEHFYRSDIVNRIDAWQLSCQEQSILRACTKRGQEDDCGLE